MFPSTPPSLRARHGRLFRILSQGTPWVLLVLGLTMTAWVWQTLVLQERSFQSRRMDGALAQTREAAGHRIEEQTRLLLGAKGLLVGRPQLGAEAWRAYVAGLDLGNLSPGTRLLGYVPREVLDGRPGSAALLEPEREAVILGPKGAGLLGLPGFQEAVSRARNLGGLAVTDALRLPGKGGTSIAFLLPVYQTFAIPSEAGARRSRFQGLVICVADGTDLFKPMYGASPIAGLDVEIYDHPSYREAGLLYDRGLCLEGGSAALVNSPGSRHVPLMVGGKTWHLLVGFVPSGAGYREARPRMVAIGGALLSFLAFGLTLFLSYSRSKTEVLAYQLRESEARFRGVAETATCAIFIYSDRIEYMNEAGSRISGYPMEEILGEPLSKLVYPLDQELVNTRAKARLRGDSVPLRYEFRLRTKQGETRWIDFAAGTVVLGNRVLGLGTAFDITDRVSAHEAKLSIERQLLEAQRLESLGLLAGGVAHDFNNLITVIQGNASIIREMPGEPKLVQDCLENINTTCRRAAELVHQMLAYSGRGWVQVQALDLNGLLLEISQLLSVGIPKSITLRYELGEDLPLVSADAAQMQQVVMNLVTNAAEAIGNASGCVTLRSGTRELGVEDLDGLRVAEALQPGPFVYLEVADTGSGMDGEIQARMFEPFFSTKFTGRGLGLAAMQGIVRGHGGGVAIHSIPGEGTLFRVYLPVQGQGTAEPAFPESGRPGAGQPVLG